MCVCKQIKRSSRGETNSMPTHFSAMPGKRLKGDFTKLKCSLTEMIEKKSFTHYCLSDSTLLSISDGFLFLFVFGTQNTKMLNFSSTFSGPPSGAGVTPPSPPPSGPLLDRRAVGSPPSSSSCSSSSSSSFSSSSSGGLHQRRHSANSLSLPPPPGARDPRLRERCYSETGDRLRALGGGGGGGSPLAPLPSPGIGQVNSSRYKTELCRPFEEHGTCKYGEKCQFAHGHQELRSLSRHPKYKTELCRTFHSIGFCPYGPRCHFIHNAEERCGPVPLNAGGRGCQLPPPPPLSAPARPRLQHSLSFAGFPSAPSLTPPPILAADWPSPSDPFALPSQELAQLFGSGLPDPPSLRPAAPVVPCPPDSLSDQEGYQSSLGSHSGSESPVMDAARRLPIFSWLSISDD
ncbi:hypothetical protein ACEWY4_022190 [Coilia grayii]|uniref:mRNA decay activator protein ZFP36 n=1 Tax=Coilia grayii TaxID=363190 RepID=A0ABD1J5A5_9TELE